MSKKPQQQFDIQSTDSFLVSYPRSGNTWCRLFLGHVITNNKSITSDELNIILPDIHQGYNFENAYQPRIIKSHYNIDQNYPKVVYILRDGRDVALAMHWYLVKRRNYPFSFESFLKSFLDENFKHGSWIKHVTGWLQEYKGDLCLLRYEDMVNTPLITFSKLCDFLKIDYDDELIKQAIQKTNSEEWTRGRNQQSMTWKEVFSTTQKKLFLDKAGIALDLGNYI